MRMSTPMGKCALPDGAAQASDSDVFLELIKTELSAFDHALVDGDIMGSESVVRPVGFLHGLFVQVHVGLRPFLRSRPAPRQIGEERRLLLSNPQDHVAVALARRPLQGLC